MADRETRLIDLAAALSDGTAIDWDVAESSAASDSERLQVRRLRLVRQLADSPVSSSVSAGAAVDVHESLLHPREGAAGEESVAPVAWGPLAVIEKIGRGQFGDVYRAADPKLDRDVALKLLRRRGHEESFASQVVHEGRLLAKVRHPGVVTVYGAERIDGRVGIWMELVRGETLEQELTRRGPVPESEIVQIGIEVCRALGAVHRAGLLHRDIKAQNVMRDADGRLVLMDFGTGRELESMDDVELAGTPLYLAPEVLAGEPATPQSDLYSVGVLLFHLATRSFPVKGRTIQDIRSAHARGERVSIESCDALPLAIRQILSRVLSPHSADRFASASDMESALSQANGRTGVERGPLRRLVAFAGGLGAIAAVVVLVLNLGFSGGDTGVVERLLASGPDTPAWPAVSPDGRHIAYVEDQKGNLAERDVATGQVRLLTNTANWDGEATEFAEQPVYSRDGKRMAYNWFNTPADGNAHWQLRVIDLAGTGVPNPRVLYEYKVAGWFGAADWSPDGGRIAVQMRTENGDARIGWVSVAEGTLHLLGTADWRMSRLLAFSPDGRHLAYDAAPTEQSATADVFLADLETGDVTRITTDPSADSVAGWLPHGDLLYLREARGTRAIWRQPIKGGRPAGDAAVLRMDWRGNLVSPTTDGVLNLSVMINDEAIHSAAIDFATGQITRSSNRAVAGVWPRNRQPKWSSDGRLFAYISSGHERALSHRVLSVNEVHFDQPRILPLKLAQLWTYDWSPDGRSILARAQSFQGRSGIYHIDAQTGVAKQLMEWSDAARQFAPQWADDGKSFYYTKVVPKAGGDYILRDLAGTWERTLFSHTKLRLADGKALPNTRDSTISPDRKYVVCYTIGPESVLWLISLRDLSVRELYRVKQSNAFVHNALAWTPGSNGVVVNQTRGDKGLWLVPLAGVPRKLDVGRLNVRPEAIALHPDGSQVAFVAGDRRTYEIIRMERVFEPADSARQR